MGNPNVNARTPINLKFSYTVEAFQMTEERRLDNSQWPQWLHEAWNGGLDLPGTLQRIDARSTHPGDMLCLVLSDGIHAVVGWYDWIIRLPGNGELILAQDAAFKEQFDPAPEAPHD